MEYDNTNRGSCFPNDKKTSDNHPDYRGVMDVEGKEFWLSVWVKTAGPSSKNPGMQYLSMSLTEKEAVAPKQVAPVNAAPATPSNKAFDKPNFPEVPADEDLPF